MNKLYLAIIGIFSFTLLLLVGYLFLENSALKSSLEKTNNRLDQAESSIVDLKDDINEKDNKIEKLNAVLFSTAKALQERDAELNNTKKQLKQLTNVLVEATDEFVELKSNINGIQESLDSSIQWFKNNANFPELEEFGTNPEKASLQEFFNEVENNCIKKSSSFDTLNLGCVSYVMETTLSFEYKLEGQDKLYSLKEMIYRNGGDCEDYSLFLKALLNHLENMYQEKELIVQAWRETTTPENYVVYEIGGKKLFYSGAEGYDLGEVKKLEPYMICYTTKFDEVSFEGHCVVALSKEPIKSITDLEKLDGAKVFEPQDGSYKGIVGAEFYVCQDGEVDCDTGINNISFVISDSDLYQFIEGEWTSYVRYKDDLTSLDGRIEGFLKGVN